MSEDYKRGYSKGYWAGSTGRWPEHKPPLPPEEKLRALIVVTQELRDELDVACAMFDEDDEFVKCLAPKIDALDAAMAQIGAWIREIPPGEETVTEEDIPKADWYEGAFGVYCVSSIVWFNANSNEWPPEHVEQYGNKLARLAALERAADAAQELVEAATKTEQARARYEYIRHQKPLDTNAELRHWLQLMQALLDQKAALSALQPDAGETAELWTLDGRFKIVSWDIHGTWVWMEDRNGNRWSYLH